MTTPRRAKLRGTGSAVPTRIVPNAEFERTLDTSDEWIRTRTGIRERRFAGPTDTTVTLGLEASRKALEAAQCSAEELDLVLCATVTPEQLCPATACTIAAKLGCRTVPAFDLSAACSGFIYALSVADQYIQTGSARQVLIIGADTLSRTVDPNDRNTCILFGDAAGAVVVGPSQGPEDGLHQVELFADGSRGGLIIVPGPRHAQDQKFQMNGREVFKFAVTRLTELVRQGLADCEKLGRRLDWLVPHQVNSRIIDAALEGLNFPGEQVIVNLDRYGNTSAASIPLALDEGFHDGRLQPGQMILLAAFGGGLTWSSALMTI